MSEAELLKFLDSGALLSKPRRVHFYAPSFMYYRTGYFCSSSKDFLTISVTGRGCALKCKHCGGRVLETMHAAVSPEKLYLLCSKLKSEGAEGCLISGGCLPDGSVPLDAFVDAIRRVKGELGLTVFAHVGIITFERAKRLKEAGVDAALIDVIGAEETIREVYRLNVSVKDYENSLEALSRAGLSFVPHVVVGLHYGKLKGEMHALRMIAKYSPSALVIIAFMPIRGTEMANVEPPKPADIAKTVAAARLMFPEKPIVLGCMRPKGKHRAQTDPLALKAGADAIAFPAEEAIRYAEKQGYALRFSSFCCAQIYKDFYT
ncbi:MAG: radical SAM protein [Nitrososphaerota archaeon]|nr:radical SAM protein [Nitrososphaerota archaeon]